VIQAMNLRVDGWFSERLQPLLSRGTKHFCEIFAETDRITGERSLAEGARYLLTHLVNGVEVCGAENIPHEGPLVVASNHPGTVDSAVITSGVSRPDFKIIAGEVPFLQHLPNISKYLIYTPYNNPYGRMKAVREALHHLKEGGSLLLFARAGIDPDPAFMPHADEDMSLWSRSLEIFLDRVPKCRVLVTVVSGVLHPRFMRHPITWLRRERPDRQRLAMMLQVIQQMLGKKIDLTPRLTFGDLVSEESAGGRENILPTIIESARKLLASHLTAGV
jgi:hypothetical protein